MTPAELATYVRYKTGTNSTTFADAEILSYMKSRQDEIAHAILKADEDILLIPQVASLVVNQREYPMPSDIISRIKSVYAKLDGTNWLKLRETDITKLNFSIASEADIVYYFANLEDECFFDILRKAIYILSGTITAVASGLKVYCDTYPMAITDLASTTDMSVDPSDTTHGIPRPMHNIWAMGVIIDYKESRDKPIPLTERESNYEFEMQKAIETLRHGNMDREIIGNLPPSDEVWNDGADL